MAGGYVPPSFCIFAVAGLLNECAIGKSYRKSWGQRCPMLGAMGVQPIHSPLRWFMPKSCRMHIAEVPSLQTAKCRVQSATICWTKVTPIPPQRDVNYPPTPIRHPTRTGTAPTFCRFMLQFAHPPNQGRFLDWPTIGCLTIHSAGHAQPDQQRRR